MPIRRAITQWREETGLAGERLLFNITGGTKVMVVVAYEEARRAQSPVIYLESERRTSTLRTLRFQEGGVWASNSEDIGDWLTLDDYLTLHVDGPTPKTHLRTTAEDASSSTW